MHGTSGLNNPWHHLRKMSSWVGNPGRPPYVILRGSAGLKKEDDVLNNGLAGDSIDEVFGHFSQGAEDPSPGPSSETLSEGDKKLLIDTVSIKAPYNHHDLYLDLCLRYLEVLSKSKLDIDRTNVIEHKVNMKSEDPIHI